MNGNEFPDLVPMANACPGRLPFIFQVLWSDADGRIRIKNVIFAYFEFPFEEYVPHQSRASAHADTGANDAIGADVRIGGDFSFGIYYGSGVDRHPRFMRVAARALSHPPKTACRRACTSPPPRPPPF